MPLNSKPKASAAKKPAGIKKPAFKIPSKNTPVTGGAARTFSATARKVTMKLVPAVYQKDDDARGIKKGDLSGNYYLRGNCDSKWNKTLIDAAAPFCLGGSQLKFNAHAEQKHLSVKV